MPVTSIDTKWVGCASGNFHKSRVNNHKPEAIVVHVMDGHLVGTDAFFNTQPDDRKGLGGFASSAHFGIGKDGTIHQYVHEEDTAYHAGRVNNPTWTQIHPGVNPNAYTIGIEHEGFSADPWPDEMMQASAQLISYLCGKYSIPIDRLHIIGHREIYSLKTCPGQCDLDKLVAMAAAL